VSATERHYSVDVDLRGDDPVVTVADRKLGTAPREYRPRNVGDLAKLAAELIYGPAPPRRDMFGEPIPDE
jgi:hypothetical protein